MKLRLWCNYQKIILAALALFLVQATCGNVAPTDPRIPESINVMAGNFGPLLNGLGIIPFSATNPPVITQISSDSVSGLGSIGNIGIGVVDSTGVSGNDKSPIAVRLYHMDLHGCEKEPTRGKLLVETTVDFGGTWIINHKFEPGEVVGATQVSEGNESGLSNLKVNLDANDLLMVDKENEIQQIEYDVSQPMVLTGSSFPGACVVLQNQNLEIGRVGSAAVTDSGSDMGKWETEVALQENENRYKVYVEGWEEIKKELVIQGFFPHMQWPYTDKDKNSDGSCHYDDTKEKKELRIENCYYKAPITAWYDRNDFYVFNNLVGGFHNAIDIAGDANSAVHAVADGEVFYIQISDVSGSGGNIVLIDHGGWVSVYVHLAKIKIDDFTAPTSSGWINPPKGINAGDQIGETGATGCFDENGNRCGVHLHFSAFLWVNGNRQKSLKEGDKPPIPWKGDNTVFKLLNVNPSANKILGNGENSSNSLADRRDTDNPKEYFSNHDYWQVNWNEIRISEFDCASGTKFDELVWGIVDEKAKKEGWICK